MVGHAGDHISPFNQKETKATADLVSWAPCWEGVCVVVMVAIFSALVSKVAFDDSAGTVRTQSNEDPELALAQLGGVQKPCIGTSLTSLAPCQMTGLQFLNRQEL